MLLDPPDCLDTGREEALLMEVMADCCKRGLGEVIDQFETWKGDIPAARAIMEGVVSAAAGEGLCVAVGLLPYSPLMVGDVFICC